jgi:uncharacterized membrane protein YdfJ with MMPL/SSD domain
MNGVGSRSASFLQLSPSPSLACAALPVIFHGRLAAQIASVALGIAVDDTLHLLSHFRAARCQGLELEASVVTALRYCGLAMFQTTVICGCSLLVYCASEFMPTQRFAVFMGLLLAMAWLGVAVLLPAMMSSRLGNCLASRHTDPTPRQDVSDRSPA